MIFFDQFKVPTVKFGKCFAEFVILIALLKLKGPCKEVGLLIKILYTYNIQFKVLISTYQDIHLSESIQTWNKGTWEESILFGGIIHKGWG